MQEYPVDQSLEELIASVPTVLALPLRRLLRATSSSEAIDYAFDVGDQLARFLGVAMVSQFLADPTWDDDDLLAYWQGMVPRNSDGAWGDLAQRALASARRAGKEPFLRELPDVLDRTERRDAVVWTQVEQGELGDRTVSRSFGRIEFLIWARNQLSHHKASRDDVSVAQRLREEAVRTLREFNWLTRYELIVGDESGHWHCRGESPRRLDDEGGRVRVFLRHVEPASSNPVMVLELVPLIETRGRLGRASSGRPQDLFLFNHVESGAVALYHGVVVEPESGRMHKDVRRSQLPVDRLHHMLQNKRFPLVGAERVDAAGLAKRLTMVTDDSLAHLIRDQKYSRNLHVRRDSCEGRLNDWVSTATPLLGVRGSPGCGKSAILASLVDGWRSTNQAPVLFLLASKHPDALTIDALICGALRLRGTSVAALSDHNCLNGLVVIIDGLNEHPHRDALLEGILVEANRTAQRGVGARFLLSWRRDDSEWISHATDQRSLWWNPSRPLRDADTAQCESSKSGIPSPSRPDEQPISDAVAGTSPTKPDGIAEQSAEGQAMGPSLASGRDDEDRDPPVLDVFPLSNDEIRAIWRALSEAWMRTGEDPLGFERDQPARHPRLPDDDRLIRCLREPLDIRIAFALHAEQPMTAQHVESLHQRFVELFQSTNLSLGGATNRFLATLATVVMSARRNRVPVSAFDADLVCATPISALELLRRAGVVSVHWDGKHEEHVSFTVERFGEQVIGMMLADDARFGDHTWLAATASRLQDLSLGQGAIRVALEQLGSGPQRRDYLIRFVDCVSKDLAGLAGALLGRHILDHDAYEARTVADLLFDSPSESDAAVVRSTAAWLWDNEEADAEKEFAFLDQALPHVRPMIVAGHPEGLGIAEQFAKCLRQRRRFLNEDSDGLEITELPDDPIGWLRSILDEMPTSTPPHARASLQHELGEHLDRFGDQAGAVEAFRETCRLLDLAAHDHLVEPSQRLRALVRCAELLHECDRHDEALALAATTWTEARRERADYWAERAARVRADSLESLRRWDEAVVLRREILARASRTNDRRDIAIAEERLGRCYHRANRLDDAVESFQRSLKAGSEPRRIHSWSEGPALYWLSRIEEERGRTREAVEYARRHVEAVRRDGEEESSKQVAIAYEQLGDCLVADGRHAEGIDAYRQAIELGLDADAMAEGWRPSIPNRGLSAALQAIGDLEGARDCWTALLDRLNGEEHRGHRASALEGLGDVERALEHPAEAERLYQLSLDTGEQPTLAPGWSPRSVIWELASLFAEQDRHDAALALFDRYIQLVQDRDDPRALAIALERKFDCLDAIGRVAEACEAARRAVEIGIGERGLLPNWSPMPATRRLAEALAQQGDIRAADETWNSMIARLKALGLRDRVAVALEFRGDLERQTNRLDAAEASYRASLAAGSEPTMAAGWSPKSVLWELTTLSRDQGRLDEALAFNLEYAGHCHQTNDRRALAISMELRADVLRSLNRTDEAIASARESMHIGMSQGQWVRDWSPLPATHRIASMLDERGEHDAACRAWQELIAVLDGEQHRGRRASALHGLGTLKVRHGKLAEAERLLGLALSTGAEPSPARHWSPRSTWLELSDVHARMDRHEESLAEIQKYLELTDANEDRRGAAIGLERLARSLIALRRYDDAVEAARLSVQAGVNDGDWVDSWSPIPATRYLADALDGKQDHDGASAAWTECIDLMAGEHRRGLRARAMEAVGDRLQRRGELHAAEEAYLRSLREGSEPETAAGWSPLDVLRELISVYAAQGRLDEALESNTRLIRAADAEQDRRSMVIGLEQRSDLFLRADDTANALEAAQLALKLGTSDGTWVESWSVGPASRQIAHAMASCGRLDEAVEVLGAAITSLQERGLRRELSRTIECLGDLLRDADELDKAEAMYRQALQTGLEPTQAEYWSPRSVLWELARVCMHAERWGEALDFNTEYARHCDSIEDRRWIAISLEQRSDILRELERHDEALQAAREALRIGVGDGTWADDWTPFPATHRIAKALKSLNKLPEVCAAWSALAALFNTEEHRRDRAVALEFLADAERDSGRIDDAEASYRASLSTGMSPTIAEDWSPRSVLWQLARLCMSQKRFAEALDFNTDHAHHCDSADHRRSLAVSLEQRSDILRELERHDEAVHAAREALRIGVGDGEWVRDWSPFPATRALCDALTELDRLSEVRAAWESAAELMNSEEHRAGRARALERLGDAEREEGLLDEAEASYTRSLECGMSPAQAARWSPLSVLYEASALAVGRQDATKAVIWLERFEAAAAAEQVVPWFVRMLQLDLAIRSSGLEALASTTATLAASMPEQVRGWAKPIITALVAELRGDDDPELAKALMRQAIADYSAALAAARPNSPVAAAGLALVVLSACPAACFGEGGALPPDRALKALRSAAQAIASQSNDDLWTSAGLPGSGSSWLRQAQTALDEVQSEV